MAYATHQFCWTGILSTDLDQAAAFYPAVLGWNLAEVPMGDDTAKMFENNGRGALHLAEPPAKGIPSHWHHYFKVDDVDAALKKAVACGGTEMTPATDIPPGRFAVVAAPSGASFSLFHEADPEGSTNHEDAPGEIHWNELHSTDLDRDLKWLQEAFDLTANRMEMPDGPYYVLKQGEAMTGGAMAATNPQAPSMWLSWVHVEDVEETRNKVLKEGGSAHTEVMEVPQVGRMAVVADPTGGVFGIITPPPVS